MIADWTVEVGPASPSIDVPWEGWVDLREEPGLVAARGLSEVRADPELGAALCAALRILNRGGLVTSKLDIFAVTREEVDPEIGEAGDAATRLGLGSYMDVLAGPPLLVCGFPQFEQVARRHAALLSKIRLGELGSASLCSAETCLAETVVRPARLFGRDTYGWTVYAMGFGPTDTACRSLWAEAALAASVALAGAVSAVWPS